MKKIYNTLLIAACTFGFAHVNAQVVEGTSTQSNYTTTHEADLKKITTEGEENTTVPTKGGESITKIINFQAVARDASGTLMTNDAVAIDFIIHEGSAGGPTVYNETQNLTTDANGVFSAQIGSVSPMTIDWNTSTFYLEVVLDGTSVGTTQFVSVPYAFSAQTMPSEALIGDNTANDADVLTVSGDNTNVGEIIDIRATNVVTTNNDMMNIEMPAGSSADAQFIEASRGGVVQYQVQGDGRTLINSTTTAPQLNTVYGNSMPIAYGSIDGGGNISTGYGITSVTLSSAGTFDVVLDHPTNPNNSIVVVTPFTSGFGAPEIGGYQPTGANTFTVRIQSPTGTPISSAFSFVVYGNQ